MLAVPVLFQNKPLGILCLFSQEAHHFSQEQMKISDIFASQVAIAIQESRHLEQTHKNYFDTIHALALALEARDPYTRGHTERVTKYVLQIARVVKMSKTEMEILRYATQVHDIGKISIPDSICISQLNSRQQRGR